MPTTGVEDLFKPKWWEKSWNPMTGCTPISEGCAHCYAKIMARRLKAMGQKKYFYEFAPIFHPGALSEPTRWKKPCLVFVCSMSDLFHKAFFDSEIRQVFDVMERVTRHKYMVLTKRPERMANFILSEDMSRKHNEHPRANIALGTTVELQGHLKPRIDWLNFTRAQYRFLSLEPLLGPIRLKEGCRCWDQFIDLVIVGGESGPGARPMDPRWVTSLRDQCAEAGVPFCFKAWGEWAPKGYYEPDKKARYFCFDGPSAATPGCPFNGLSAGGNVFRFGRKRAGRELYGQTHDGAIQWRA